MAWERIISRRASDDQRELPLGGWRQAQDGDTGRVRLISRARPDPQDPKEWTNLAGRPEYQEVERKLHALIMANFDPDQIERDVQEGLARRRLLKEAMDATGLPKWDYQPFFDATRRYWRKGWCGIRFPRPSCWAW